MNESRNDSKVYEIGYLLMPTIPAEKVGDKVASLQKVLSGNGANITSEEAPELIALAYEMIKASGSGSNQRFSEGYFGWIKFECEPTSVEAIRKAFEADPAMLRVLAVSTVREKTYLGKRMRPEGRAEDKAAPAAAPAAPMTDADIAKVDKSIDEMVKNA